MGKRTTARVHNSRRYRSGLEKEAAAFLTARQKVVKYELHVAIKQQHPELDIRFVFSNANAKLYKGAKSRYFEWCDKNNFLWAHRVIPEEWLTEPGSRCKTDRITLKTIRKD